MSKSFELRTFFGGIPLLTQPPVGVTLAEVATSNPAWMISTYLGDSQLALECIYISVLKKYKHLKELTDL